MNILAKNAFSPNTIAKFSLLILLYSSILISTAVAAKDVSAGYYHPVTRSYYAPLFSVTLPNRPGGTGVVITLTDTNKIYSQIPIQPIFPGGVQALGNYFTKSIRYPAADRQANISGRVICTFVVEKDGSLSNIKAVRGPSETLNAEAIRVLAASPKWTPGKTADGQAVRVAYTMPINFQLDGGGKTQVGNGGFAGMIMPGTSIDTVFKRVQKSPNAPMFVVDGVEFGPDNPLPAINKENIVSVEVLKNEAATKKYGDKAKNGAIIITTKKK